MDPTYVSLLSGLIGAVIGSIGSVATVYIQGRRDDKRQRRETAIQLALAERDQHIEIAKERGAGPIFPIAVYLANYDMLLKSFDEGIKPGDITRAQEASRKLAMELENAEIQAWQD